MWNNYFYQIRKKYSMRLSSKNPLVINLDAKDVTKDKNINILDSSGGGFLDCLEKTTQYFSGRYSCIAICGADEVSFIFQKPLDLVESLNNDKDMYSTEVISVFSQYFFEYFNHFDFGRKIFWHGKCFSIKEDKITSYLKYKSKLIKVLTTTNFLKRKGIDDAGNISLEKKEAILSKYHEYNEIKEVECGTVYKDGKKFKINNFNDENLFSDDNFCNDDDIEIEIQI